MGRARETASFTAKDHGLDVQVLDFMHEIDWGDINPDTKDKLPYNGHLWTLAYKLLTQNPEMVGSDRWKEHHYFKDNVCMKYFDLISEGIDNVLSQYGLVRKNNLYYVEKECNDTIALFAHGGSGAILFSYLLSLPFPFVLTGMPYGVCSVSIFDFNPQPGKMTVPRIELFNDMGHIVSFKAEPLHFEK